MRADEIAAALDGRREGRNWRCRCPVHGGCSLSLREGHSALLVRCWAGCETRDVLAELRRLHLIAGQGDSARPATTNAHGGDHEDFARRIALAQRIWHAARSARGSPIARYLSSRGITMPPPPSLRWAARCRHPSGIYLPAMVARIDNVDGVLIGIHRTFLRPDGNGKADINPEKAMLGRAAGGAVRLAPAAETLLVGEGIESALYGMVATGLPGWAALSAAGIEAAELPPEVHNVVIAVDRDRTGAGERSARRAAGRWFAGGRRVRLIIPNRIGVDANDLLRETRDAG
jgi:hypothetical protein